MSWWAASLDTLAGPASSGRTLVERHDDAASTSTGGDAGTATSGGASGGSGASRGSGASGGSGVAGNASSTGGNASASAFAGSGSLDDLAGDAVLTVAWSGDGTAIGGDCTGVCIAYQAGGDCTGLCIVESVGGDCTGVCDTGGVSTAALDTGGRQRAGGSAARAGSDDATEIASVRALPSTGMGMPERLPGMWVLVCAAVVLAAAAGLVRRSSAT